MKAFKGFNTDMTCRGFQYEEGKTYEEPIAKLCKSGFHACENPMDCMGYYDPANSVYHEVELENISPEKENDSKIVGTKITIGAKLSVPKFVELSIQYMKEHCKKSGESSVLDDYSTSSNTGNRSMASNTGDYSTSSNTGNRSMASNTGDFSMASNTGDFSMASNTGDQSTSSNTGFYSMASNTGNYSTSSNTGFQSMASNTGDFSMASNTGDFSMASNTGDFSMASNTGYCSMASNTGKQGIAASVGIKGKARGAIGSWLILAEWALDDDDNWQRTDVQCRKVDGETIKPDTWYTLKNGEFIEAEE